MSLGLITLYLFPYPDGSPPLQVVGFYLRSYARAAGGVLALFDPTVHVSGVLISGRFPLRIVRSCDAGEAMALLVAAVTAFPATWKERLTGAIAGTAVIFVVNVVRICALYFTGVLRPDLFDFVHHDVWPLVIILVALVVFVAWATWVQREAGDRDPNPA
jgi:exosortase H (IPTLxxWG-CTERM-specific)